MGHMANDKKRQHAGHRSIDEVLVDLKKTDLKLTVPRKAILQALVDEHGPFTAEEVHKRIPRRICDLATVYRALASLEEVGILRRCEFGDGSARYELCEQGKGQHHHLICKKCKKVEIIDECELAGVDRVAQKRGFSDVSHILEFFGFCPDCK